MEVSRKLHTQAALHPEKRAPGTHSKVYVWLADAVLLLRGIEPRLICLPSHTVISIPITIFIILYLTNTVDRCADEVVDCPPYLF